MDDVVDAHHHLWVRARTPQPWIDPASMSRIDADFTPADLPARTYGVEATVVVQSADSWAESRELLRIAGSDDGAAAGVTGVVAWADLTAPDLADRLAALRDGPGGAHLAGIRTQVQAETDPGHLDRLDVRRGLGTVAAAGLAFDLVLRADQLPAAARLARDLPQVRFVLDHLGKPDLRGTATDAASLAAWRCDLTALAAAPNVTAKISGLVTEARWQAWTAEDLRPAVDHALDAFGPDRLMFGSDWPVCLLATGYGDWLATARTLLAGLGPAERAAIFAGTARRTYALEDIDDQG
ncbi:amidohydrolase family protein [Isoptericola croceus]|uniref:amidohydrolase family protein n=1 Tax=Isoptericola croceus TaxID=3031406 RepID=UPI0023F8E0C5|nr:amidohydrolase family protein [Isoptericola croceus]